MMWPASLSPPFIIVKPNVTPVFWIRMNARIRNFRVLSESTWCRYCSEKRLSQAGGITGDQPLTPPSLLGSGGGAESCRAGRRREELRGRGALPLRNRPVGSQVTFHGDTPSLTHWSSSGRKGWSLQKVWETSERTMMVRLHFLCKFDQLSECISDFIFTWWGGEASWTAPALALQSWGSSAWHCRYWLQPPGCRAGWARWWRPPDPDSTLRLPPPDPSDMDVLPWDTKTRKRHKEICRKYKCIEMCGINHDVCFTLLKAHQTCLDIHHSEKVVSLSWDCVTCLPSVLIFKNIDH